MLADLLDQDGYRVALGGRDAVVHLAAVLRSTDDDEIRQANLEATRRLAGAALDAGVARFVFTSTNLVYPGGLGRPASEDDESPVTAVALHALNGVPFPDRPAGDADLWHGVVDTTRIRRELGFRPWYPSVWSARDAGAL